MGHLFPHRHSTWTTTMSHIHRQRQHLELSEIVVSVVSYITLEIGLIFIFLGVKMILKWPIYQDHRHRYTYDMNYNDIIR